MRRLAFALLAVASLFASACINIESNMTLERDMSGTAGFLMRMDMEPIVGFAATMKHSMSGKPGAPSAAEIAAVRDEMLASAKTSKPMDMEKEKADLAKSLPAGVKLMDALFTQDGLKMAADIKLAFDHASKLNNIKLDSSSAAQGIPMENPVDSPFGGLKVVDEGKTILVTSPPQNPLGEKKAELGQMTGADPAMKGMVETMLKGLRVAFKITSPLEIVEHNAHRKEGNTLVWEYNVAALEKLTPEQMAQDIRVRYRK